MNHARAVFAAAAFVGAAGALAQGDTPRNWFDDPFFQVTSGVPDCPTPAGPRLTESERRGQAHHRAERGTSCWLSGDCEQPSAYAHDAQIARDLLARWRSTSRFDSTSLWVTVQHATVFIEGCVSGAVDAAALEAFARATAHVQQAVAIVHADLKTRPPYKVLEAPRPLSPQAR
jgi:hypothetical protein